jgi:ATP adenylyltransferase
MEYLDQLREFQSGCFFCDYGKTPENDEQNLVLCRGKKVFSVLNRFPYTGGHSLVAPYAHIGRLEELDDETLNDLIVMVRNIQVAISGAMHPNGFNIGLNIGLCAGAGIPDHLHAHIVPRWSGDTNFMPVLGDVRVIPEFLGRTRDKILNAMGTSRAE